MKLGLISILFLLAACATSPKTRAPQGGADGGGGGAVVCPLPGGGITARLADLEEAEFYERRTLDRTLEAQPWQAQVATAIDRVAFVDPQFHQRLLWYTSQIISGLSASLSQTRGTETVFPAPQDLSAARLPPMKIGCALYGAAIYSKDMISRNSPLTISDYLWQKFSEMHKAGLILHEAIYLMHREALETLKLPSTDSAPTRRLVGLLLSDELRGHSFNEDERFEFKKDSSYEAHHLENSRQGWWKLISPLTTSGMLGLGRSVYLNNEDCRKNPCVVRVYPSSSKKPDCEVTATALPIFPTNNRTSTRKLRAIVVKNDPGAIHFEYRALGSKEENLLLTCKAETDDDIDNPGFLLQTAAGEHIGFVTNSTRRRQMGIAIRFKESYRASFLPKAD